MRKSHYSKEFKDSTIKFCIDNSDKSISSIAKDLGLNKGTLSLWVNDYKTKYNLNPTNESKNESLEEENKRLRKELAIVKKEREILKKAAAPQEYFLSSLTAHTLRKKLCEVCLDRK